MLIFLLISVKYEYSKNKLQILNCLRNDINLFKNNLIIINYINYSSIIFILH